MSTAADEGTAADDGTTAAPKKRREFCSRCSRPTPRACICAALPEHPVSFAKCRVVVLQHPHEVRRKNRSLPLVELCVGSSSGDLQTVVGRRFGEETDTVVMKLLQDAKEDILLVYPCEEAVTLQEGLRQVQERRRSLMTEVQAEDRKEMEGRKVTLVFIDATWKYAREMEKACAVHKVWPEGMIRIRLSPEDYVHADCSSPCARDGGDNESHKNDSEETIPKKKDLSTNLDEVSPKTSEQTEQQGTAKKEDACASAQDLDESEGLSKTPSHSVVGTSEAEGPSSMGLSATCQLPSGYKRKRFDIRTPPSSNHLSTAEAIAWVVSVVEGDPSIYQTLMAPLDLMVQQWHSFSDNRPGAKPRSFTDGDDDDGKDETSPSSGTKRKKRKRR